MREQRPEYGVDEAARSYAKNLRWDRELKNNLRRRRTVHYSVDNIWVTQYRPFVRQHCYVDYVLVNNKYQQDRIFPPPALGTDHCTQRRKNRAIGVPTVGDTKPFSCVMVNRLPDLNIMTGSQWFPRYRYERRIASSASRESVPTSRARFSPTECPTSTSSNSASAFPDGPTPNTHGDETGLFETEVERVDNITDTALRAFQEHYSDDAVTKDAIFDYVYGVLHAPALP